MQLLNFFIDSIDFVSHCPNEATPINDVFKLIQIYFPNLPNYQDCPRTSTGRPYLKQEVVSINYDDKQTHTELFSWNNFCSTFNLNPQKKYKLIDFNISNSKNILCCSFLLIDYIQEINNNLIPTIGIDIEFLNRKLPNRKLFSKKILHPDDAWYKQIIYLENQNWYSNTQIPATILNHYRQLALITWGAKEAIIKAYGSSIIQGKSVALTTKGIQIESSLSRYNPHKIDDSTKKFLIHSTASYQLQHCILQHCNSTPQSFEVNQNTLANYELISYFIYAPYDCGQLKLYVTTFSKIRSFLLHYNLESNSTNLNKVFTLLQSHNQQELISIDSKSLTQNESTQNSLCNPIIISQHHM